jgi:hypothetical protein
MAASLLQPPSHQMSRFALTHHSQTRYALLLLLLLLLLLPLSGRDSTAAL